MQETVAARSAGENVWVGVGEPSLLAGAAIEVRVIWGENTILVRQIEPLRGFRIASAEAEKVDFVVPEDLAEFTVWPLISADEVGVYLNVPAAATGNVDFADGTASPLEQLRGRLPVAADASRTLCLQKGMQADVLLGGLRFHFNCIPSEAPMARSFMGDTWRTSVPYFAASLLSFGALLGAMAYLMPPMGLTDGAGLERDQLIAMQAYLNAAAEREQEPKPDAAGATSETAGGEDGAKAAGEDGAMGKADAPKKNARAANTGPSEKAEPVRTSLHEAATFGMVNLLAGRALDPDGPSVDWADPSALGSAALSAQGNMWGDKIADAAGANGLGISSFGDGGGGQHRGIGLSRIGTWGAQGNCLPGQYCNALGDGGAGRSWGRTMKERKSGGIRMRSAGPVTVSGRLPPQVIQRIVRQNFGRYRHCYEQGLSRNPNLQGRVAVRFLISSDGSVAQAGSGGTSLSDSAVVSCVVKSFYGLSFPKPQGGTVRVTYPLMFSPG